MRQGRAEAWTKWRRLVGEQGESGQSVEAFCRERGLPDSQFFAWKKRLRKSEAAAVGGEDLSRGTRVARFVAVEVARRSSRREAVGTVVHGGAIEVWLRGGRSLVVERGFDGRCPRGSLSVLEAEA